MRTSEKNEQIIKAVVGMQADMVNVKKNAMNPFTSNFYADLGRALETVRPVLAKHKLAVIQTTDKDYTFTIPDKVRAHIGDPEAPPATVETLKWNVLTVSTRLVHESGEWVETSMAEKVDGYNAQQIGSLITYFRRYQLLAVCGTAPEDEDDDGVMTRIEEKAKSKVKDVDGKKAGAAQAAKTPARAPERPMDQVLSALPRDLTDLMAKAGCVSPPQKWKLYQMTEGNVVEMRNLCNEALKNKRTLVI